MKAWVIEKKCEMVSEREPLRLVDMALPELQKNQVLLKILTCGICHTEIDEVEGRTMPAFYPIVPGHQVVAIVQDAGESSRFSNGARVGVAWIYAACGRCEYCRSGNENLCENFTATGRDANGGYAEYMIANNDFIYALPSGYSDTEAAPLLCSGAIGYRSLDLTGLRNGESLGLVGFGSSAHLVLQIAKYRYPESPVFVFSRNRSEQQFSLEHGADWAGSIEDEPPSKLNAIIDTTPVWRTVLAALSNLKAGGRLVVNAIAKEDQDKRELLNISFPEHLWREKEIKSVANITRRDVSEFLELASSAGIRPTVETYPFGKANEALTDLKDGKIRGSKVLLCSE
jgi:alcohol dehydrogenase, propanol-preferring